MTINDRWLCVSRIRRADSTLTDERLGLRISDVAEQARARLEIEDQYVTHLACDIDADQAAMALMPWMDLDGIMFTPLLDQYLPPTT